MGFAGYRMRLRLDVSARCAVYTQQPQSLDFESVGIHELQMGARRISIPDGESRYYYGICHFDSNLGTVRSDKFDIEALFPPEQRSPRPQEQWNELRDQDLILLAMGTVAALLLIISLWLVFCICRSRRECQRARMLNTFNPAGEGDMETGNVVNQTAIDGE